MALHPEIVSAFCSYYDADILGEASIVEVAPSVASRLSNSSSDLTEILQDVRKLQAGDTQALRELNLACNWEWGEDLQTHKDLVVVLSACEDALVFRLKFEAPCSADDKA